MTEATAIDVKGFVISLTGFCSSRTVTIERRHDRERFVVPMPEDRRIASKIERSLDFGTCEEFTIGREPGRPAVLLA